MNLKFSVDTTTMITLQSFEGLPEVSKESKEPAEEALEILGKIISSAFKGFLLTVVDEANCLYTATNVEHEDALEMLDGAIEEFLE